MIITKSVRSRKKRSSRVKHIALLLESDMAFDRAIARGVGEYIRTHTGWIIFMDPMTEVNAEVLRHWAPDGIIASIRLPNIKEISRISGVPMVGFGGFSGEQDAHLNFPVVTSSQEEIGRMAARYFITKGLRHFAFCGGDEDALWCHQRQIGFVDELQKQNFSCALYNADAAARASLPGAIRSLEIWLKSLPKPTGVFVFFDGWARWVLEACVHQHLQVPQDLSVLGVDNDEWLCELSQPRLSSIETNIKTAGYVAADLLNQLMSGATALPPLTYILPSTVVERDSTNYLAFLDPEVAFAMRYIKEHACDPISPADVLRVTGMSNSTAHRKFLKALGRSIHSEIQRVQMDRVKEFLTTTNLNVTELSKKAGFENTRYLMKVFRDSTGMTPTEYRRSQSTPKVAGDF